MCILNPPRSFVIISQLFARWQLCKRGRGRFSERLVNGDNNSRIKVSIVLWIDWGCMQQFAFQRRCREVNITFINCGGCVQQCYRSQTSNMLMTPTAATICGIQTVGSNSKSLVVEYTFTSSECVFIQITAAAVSSFFVIVLDFGFRWVGWFF